MDGQTKALEVADYEVYVQDGRRRFRTVVGSVIVGLLTAIYAPWAFVTWHALSSGVAATVSVIAGLFLLAAWQGLLTRLSNPLDSLERTAEGRRTMLRALLIVAIGIVALLVAMAASFYRLRFIQSDGLLGTGLLLILMSASLLRALLFRAVRSRPAA